MLHEHSRVLARGVSARIVREAWRHKAMSHTHNPVHGGYLPVAFGGGHAHWTCPACTLFRANTHGRCIVGSAPYTPGSPAGTEHIRSRKHIRAMKYVQPSLFQAHSMTEYFSYILEEPMPNFDRTTPSQAFKAYVARCGGDPDRTIAHFALPGADTAESAQTLKPGG